MKKTLRTLIIILCVLIPALVIAEIQGADMGLGGGGTGILGRVNEALTNLASGDGKANFFATNRAGVVYTTVVPTTANGETPIKLSALTNGAIAIKASAGQLYSYHCFNPAAAAGYVQIFNVAAASVILGTTVPVLSLGIPAGGAGNLHWGNGIPFSTAMSAAVTTTAGGSTAGTAASDCNFTYK